MSKHTKGPWVLDGPTVNSESYDCYYVKTKDGTIVAEIGGWGGSGGMENDGRLIAAAPDLLEALREAYDSRRIIDERIGAYYVPLTDKIQAAMTKAESK